MGKTRNYIIFIMVMVLTISTNLLASSMESLWLLPTFVRENYRYLQEKREVEKIITLSAAGDVTLGYYYGQNEWNRFDKVVEKQGYSYFFEKVLPIFQEDDVTIVNLEGPLTNGGKRVEKQFAMKGMPEYTEILKKGSVEAVSLANNHSYDYGTEGYKQTKEVLNQARIGYSGEESNLYIEIKGIKIALIGAKGWDNSKTTKEKLQKRIVEASGKADLVIVMFHWGSEGKFYPLKEQQDLAYYVIDQGVDLVLGSHPHVIQGIEKYKGKSIVYSLSNFSFGGNRNPSDKDSFIYQETFKLTEEGIVSVGSKVIPCRISSVTNNNNYQPTPLEGKAGIEVIERLKTYSNKFKESYFK